MKLTADKTIKNFLSQLATEGKSLVSIKNYKSDLNHFLAWAVLKLKSFGTYAESFAEIAPFINHSFFEEYKNFMVGNKVKIKTINRRLSTVRNLSRFLFASGVLDEDFTHGIQNVGIGQPGKMQEKVQDIVESFRESLDKDKKVSPNTVKNYISDVRNFLAWVNETELAKKKGALPNGS